MLALPRSHVARRAMYTRWCPPRHEQTAGQRGDKRRGSWQRERGKKIGVRIGLDGMKRRRLQRWKVMYRWIYLSSSSRAHKPTGHTARISPRHILTSTSNPPFQRGRFPATSASADCWFPACNDLSKGDGKKAPKDEARLNFSAFRLPERTFKTPYYLQSSPFHWHLICSRI